MSSLLAHAGLLFGGGMKEYELFVAGSTGTAGIISHYKDTWEKSAPVVDLSKTTETTQQMAGNGLALSDDGRYLIGSRSANTMELFDRTKGWSAITPPTYTHAHLAVHSSFSPDGSRYLAVFPIGDNLRIFNTTSLPWTVVSGPASPPVDAGRAVAFKKDGTQVCISALTTTRVYNWPAMTVVGGTPAGLNNAYAVAYSPDGAYLAAAKTSQPALLVYNTTTWASVSLTNPVAVGGASAYTLSWSPNGDYLAVSNITASGGVQRIEVYETSGWTKVAIPAVITGGVISGVSWSPDSKYLAYVSQGLTRIMDITTLTEVFSDSSYTRSSPICLFTPFRKKDVDPYGGYLISRLHFDGAEGSSVITDSVAGKTWTAYGSGTLSKLTTVDMKYVRQPALITAGVVNGKVLSDSSVTDAFGTQDFTIRTRMKLASAATLSGRAIFDTRLSASTDMCPTLVFTSTTALSFQAAGVTLGSITHPWAVGVWYDIEVTRASGVTYLFLNGNLITSFADTNNYVNSVIAWGAVSWSTGVTGVSAYLEECEVYKGIALHTATFSPPIMPRPNN